MIFLPLLGLLGGFAESMRHGPIRLSAAMLGSLLAIINLLAAAVVGALMALDTAGTGTMFDFGPATLAPAQMIFVATAAVLGALAGLAHWGPQLWGGVGADKPASASMGLVDVGGGIIGVTLVVEAFVQAGGENTANALFGGLEAAGALLAPLGVLGSVVGYLKAAREDAGPEQDELIAAGLTLEWQVPVPALAAGRTVELPAIDSPYPLFESEEDA